MILYGSPISPYVRKVASYCAEKGLTFEPVAVGIGDPNPDFGAISPFRKMPALKDGDFGISDSSAIIAYLEAKHPEPPMFPASPEGKARVTWFDEFADTIVTAAGGKIFFNRIVSPRFVGKPGDEALALAGEQELIPVYDYLEKTIPASGFLVGDQLTLADLAVASALVNPAHCGIIPDASAYPVLTGWLAAMHARPSLATSIAIERKILKLG